MSEWLKSNGGPPGLVVVGAGLIFDSWPLGALFIVLGVLLWLNDRPWIPFEVVLARKIDLALAVSDLVLTTDDKGGPGRIQILGTAVNRGSVATTLHSWALELHFPNERIVRGIHLPDAPPLNTERPSLSDATSIAPQEPGALRGYVTFGFTQLDPPGELKPGILRLSAVDQRGKTWTFEQRIATLMDVGSVPLPA